MKMKYLTMFLGLVLCLSNPKECVAQHCITFDYDDKGNCVERAFHEDCDKENDEKNITASIETEQEECISLYPNPTRGSVMLTVPGFCDYKSVNYDVYDMNGVSCQSGSVISEEFLIDIGGLLPGSYIVFVNADGVVFSQTVLKF